jgi:hypothetical protein
VCLHCGEVGHMVRECALPRPLRPGSSPGNAAEPARKRVNDGGHGLRVDEGAGGPPGCQRATVSPWRHTGWVGLADDGAASGGGPAQG